MKFKKLMAVLLTVTLMAVPVNSTKASLNKNTAEMGGAMLKHNMVLLQENDRLLSSSTSKFKKYTTISEAADNARAKMLNHETGITVYIKSTDSNMLSVFDKFEDEVFKETDNGEEGDYLFWNIKEENPWGNMVKSASKKNKYYYYQFKIVYEYFTTLEQKQQVEQKVKEIIAGFNFTSETTEYEKIKTIYDYVCTNVTYADDLTNDIVYTSWSALFRHEAVCQGYAQLMYRMLKEAGISNRLIPGYGKNQDINHGWNIVKIGDYYYNLDATWDSEYAAVGKAYKFFLKGDQFQNHTRMASYNTTEFYSKYPMAAKDYGVGTPGPSTASEKSAFNIIKPKFKSISGKRIKLVKVAEAKKYQIKYSTNKKFQKETKTVTTKKTTYKLKKLKKKNSYYVKFRAYKYINSKKVYTQWSKVKRIKKVK